jgi:hypothetical protein
MFTDKKHPEIEDIVKHIRFTNGEEAIELDNGGLIEFSARSRQAARGFDGISLVVFDEAQELVDDQVEAIMATLSASTTGTRQLIYTGTPPYPGCPGTVFRRRRTACLNDPGKHDAWHEWSIDTDNLGKIDISDKEHWFATNPALGVRLTEDFTEEEFRSMSADGFARERLGWWAPEITAQDDKALDLKSWEACKSSEPKPEAVKTAYGVKFSADGSMVCLCGAVVDENDHSRIALIDQQPTGRGIQWLADWLNERVKVGCCVVIDGRNGVDLLIDRIRDTWKYKDSIIKPSAHTMVAAASLLVAELGEQTLTWYIGQEALNQSAISSVKRPISGGWGFGGEDSIAIEGCSLALWGVRNSRRNPSKQMRIG